MKTIGSIALKLATFLLGHSDVLVKTIVDAHAKNIPALAIDAVRIAEGVKESK